MKNFINRALVAKKHLKLFFALFAMLALGVTNAWAAEIEMSTFTATAADMDSYISYSTAKGGGTSNPAVNSGAIRLYQNSSGNAGGNITITAKNGATITEVTIGSSMGTSIRWEVNGAVDASNTSLSANGKVTKSDLSVSEIKCHCYGTSSSTRLYVNYLKVVYTTSSGETPGTGGEEPDPEPEPGTGGEETWTLVTNASDLKVGDQVVIAAAGSDYALGTTQNTNNRNAVGVTKGTNTITIGDDVQIITLETGNVANTFAFNTGSAGYLYAASSTANNLKTKTTLDNNGSWAISITSAGVATIQAKGTNTRNLLKKNSSSALFSCYGSGQSDVAIYKKVTSTDEPGSTEPVVSLTANQTSLDFGTYKLDSGDEKLTQKLTIKGANLTSNVTLSVAAPFEIQGGTTTLTPSAGTIDQEITLVYNPTEEGTHDDGKLTISSPDITEEITVTLIGKAVKNLEGTWILVTDASSLNAGDEIIIAAKETDVALSTTQNNNNRGEVAITKNSNTITATSEAQVLTLQAGKTEGTLALYTGVGYLHAASSSNNHLKTETELSNNSSWTIAVEADGTATLTAQGTYTRNTLCYNKSNKLFACYASTNLQQPIAIYKNTNGQQLAGLAYATTKYLTKLGDAFATPALTNPNSLAVTYSSSDNNVATVAADGAVTIKAAGIVTITASFEGNTSFLDGSAKYTICVTEHAGTQADPYSVADAKRVIDVMETAEGVYATGIVSEIVTAYNSTYGNITYNISVDGTTTGDQLQAYRGFSYDGDWFTSADDIKVGDEVVVKGNLKKHNTTYEFDAGNQLVSLNRTKEQAGLAYAETEHTANVGEDFAEPALTNLNNLTVTYSSSNTTLATVNATTGEVTILAAGKVTITATTAGDATYAAGSASYNITITNPGLAVATLPFAFNGNKAAIETTAGMTQNGLGSDYSTSTAPNSQLKFDGTGDWVVIRFDSEPEKLSYDIKNNSFSGGKFSVQESADGETYTDVAVHTTITDLQSEEYELNSASRYVMFIYTTKSSGNVGLGNISITKADHRQEAGLAWNPATVSLTVGDAFTAPTFSNPNNLTGITFASDNEALATVTNAGVISLVSGKTGIATITATYAGDATYKAAEVTCTITVDHKSEDIVILAKCKDQYYALVAENLKSNVLKALPVEYVGGKIYNVETEDQASIIWKRSVVDGKTTFKNGENYLSAVNSADLNLATEACEWVFDGDMYKIEGSTRTILYYTSTGGFKNYSTQNISKDGVNGEYSSAAITVAPVFADGDAYHRTVTKDNYGTLCIPFGSNVGNYSGAEFYEISWMEMDGTTPKGIWLDQVNGALTAGKPYIFKATADEIAIVGDGTTAADPVVGVAGLTGTFTLIQDIETSDPSNTLEGNYMISGNQFLLCPAGCWLNANRAYIDATIIANHTTKKAEIPGRRRVCLGETSENEATGFENIVAPEGQAVKAIVNGQLIIIRDGVKYNVQGQKL